jgi:hypothetical protein
LKEHRDAILAEARPAWLQVLGEHRARAHHVEVRALRSGAIACWVATLVVAGGCTAQTPAAHRAMAAPTTRAAARAVTCVKHDRNAKGIGLPEIRGTSTSPHVSLWALSFAGYPVPPRREDKIVWRMTVTRPGPVTFSATGPDGRRIGPAWGPELHGGSNWNRPGTEWGTAFRFPSPGCWTVHVKHGSQVAEAGVLVGHG